MEKNARIIAQFYHYISEGIISFYAILLVLQFSEEVEASYASFILILLVSAFVFTFFAYRELSVVFYILMVPILAVAFYMTAYILSLIILFSILLPYRYYRIEQTEIKRREAGYLGASGLLVVFLMVFNGDNEVIWIFLIQFLITFVGYYLTNLMLTSKALRTGLLLQFAKMSGFILLGVLVAYLFISEIVTRIAGVIWQGISLFIVFFSSIVSGLFSWVQPDPTIYEEEQENDDKGIQKSELGESIMDGVESYAIIYIILALTIMIIALIILFLKWRRAPRDASDELDETIYELSNDKMQQQAQQSRKRSWRDIFKRPEHPARRLVYQFEKKLFKSKHARYSHETLEKWLGRIGDGTELEVYQRVRYGDQEVSADELNELKQELNNLAERLN